MENISRIEVYRYLASKSQEIGISTKVRALLDINLAFLEKLEGIFLKEHKDRQEELIYKVYRDDFSSEYRVRDIFEDNISNVRKMHLPQELKIEPFIEEVQQLIGKEQKERVLFERMLKRLNKFNDKHIKDISDFFANRYIYPKQKEVYAEAYIERIKKSYDKNEYTKVFLSYAYVDKLYTGALYFFFLEQGIELYIDWMHNPYLKDGKVLKEKLRENLAQSEQFLFLRSVNSELHLGGSYYVRPWCAWELGNYYEHIKNEKYYISLYGTPPRNNMQLDGLKMLKGIHSGRLTEL
ncbi:MAG: toll/interleukin-1 receptor domain-containing protein [Lachnospiraceae bacterium]|nr:toll/interleukin-1 receptor domain-containing protein [Lachnospiraceae bacterium]MBQ6996589.1 toll/interleukin-1 receptor domain-containing protein [Lachnospiraceae bacterium]